MTDRKKNKPSLKKSIEKQQKILSIPPPLNNEKSIFHKTKISLSGEHQSKSLDKRHQYSSNTATNNCDTCGVCCGSNNSRGSNVIHGSNNSHNSNSGNFVITTLSRSFNNNNNNNIGGSNNNSTSRSTSKKPYGTLPRNGGILIAVRDWSKKTPQTSADPTNYYEKLLLNSTKLKQQQHRDHQHFYENHSIIRKCKDSSASSLLSIEPIYAVVNKLNKKRSKNNGASDEPKLRSTTSEYATLNNNNNDNEKQNQQQQQQQNLSQQGESEGATIENQQNENNEFSIYAKVWKGPKKSSESKMYVLCLLFLLILTYSKLLCTFFF